MIFYSLFKKYGLFILGFVLTTSLLWPLFYAPYFPHHDDVQTIRLYEMHQCIKDGQIPCRWVPNLGALYGYPLFNYYGPLPYYIGEIFYLLSGNLIFSAKAMFGISFVGAYIFMYLLAKRLWGEMGGVVSGIFYSYAPYHAAVFYVRGAMGEMWGLLFFPAILWAVLRLKERVSIGNLLLVSLFLSGLLISHNLSALLFIPILLAFILLLFILQKDFKFLKYSAFSIILSISMASFYFIPMLAEKEFVHVETTTYGYFSYTEHFKGIRKLFLDRSWGWGSSVREIPGGEKDGMSFQIGWIHILGWTLGMASFWYLKRKDMSSKVLLLFFSLVTLSSIFMIHPRSEFVWRLFESLKFIQFPWRFLMLVILSISIITGSIFLWINEKIKKMIFAAIIIACVAFNFSYFRPQDFLYITDADLLTGEKWKLLINRSIFDFLPKSAEAPPDEFASSDYQVLTGVVNITDYREGSNWLTFNADVKDHAIIRISRYYFPDWEVFVDGKPVHIDYNNHLGLITIMVGKGKHFIQAQLYDTPIRTISNWISILGITIFLMFALLQIKTVSFWAKYYKSRFLG